MRERGYIAIISVLIIGAVVLAIAVTVSLLAIGEGQTSLALTKGEDALQFSEGCMEDAMLKALNNNSYVGGTITRPEGTCTITASKSSNNWTVTATSTATVYRRTIQAHFTRSGRSITITDWQEI